MACLRCEDAAYIRRMNEQQKLPDQVIAGRVRVEDSWIRGEVWVTGESISAVFPGVDPSKTPGVSRVDVGDAFVLPGAIDSHVHSLSYGGEGVAAATRSAAAGGVTTVVEMPFDVPDPINTLDRLHAKQDMVANEAAVDVAILGTLAPDGGWREAEAMSAAGAVGYKVSLYLTDPHRFPRINDLELLNVMNAVKDAGGTLCIHAENNEIVHGLSDQQDPHDTDPRVHLRTRPPVSETLGVVVALEEAAYTGVRLHLCHLSLPRGAELVSWYKGQGTNASLETCPHYLTFSEDDMMKQRARLKINPPLRPKDAVESLWNELRAGQIDIVSSDHAPWPLEMKTKKYILENASGVPGVETLPTLVLGQALQRDPSLSLFNAALDAITITPARRFGLSSRKGSLGVGKDADIMVFQPGDQAIDGSAQHSNAGWSPYDGLRPGGAVTHVFSRGTLIYSAADGLNVTPGRGEILTRDEVK